MWIRAVSLRSYAVVYHWGQRTLRPHWTVLLVDAGCQREKGKESDQVRKVREAARSAAHVCVREYARLVVMGELRCAMTEFAYEKMVEEGRYQDYLLLRCYCQTTFAAG